MEGDVNTSLEYVDKVLEHRPDNTDAKRLKIKLLESSRRYVEAAELKYEVQHSDESEYSQQELKLDGVRTSLIIPTALHGKPMLENCLISVDKHCNPDQIELIIVDNASLDDTYGYIQKLEEVGFFNCRVITNQRNKGFAASVNQGLDIAKGKYACIMHNDVELESPVIKHLEQLMEKYPDFALAAPLSDGTPNQDQTLSAEENYDEELVETKFLDSF